MQKAQYDEQREHRIQMEAIVDCYDSEEVVMGWYYYLDDRLTFPFQAHCLKERSISPLHEGEEIEVVGMADMDDCRREMLVEIAWKGRSLSVPLEQLAGVDIDEATDEAIADWQYWMGQGYQLY